MSLHHIHHHKLKFPKRILVNLFLSLHGKAASFNCKVFAYFNTLSRIKSKFLSDRKEF